MRAGTNNPRFNLFFVFGYINSRADQLYENGLLRKVIVHEIGHALGLGHSTVKDDIMCREASVDNSTLYDVGACEFAAVRTLYQDHKVSENLEC